VPNIISVAPVVGVEDRKPAISATEMPARERPIERLICGSVRWLRWVIAGAEPHKVGFELTRGGHSNRKSLATFSE
jgi:hypothetical protein